MVKSLNNNKIQGLLLLYFILIGIATSSQNGNTDYRRFVDSADNHIDKEAQKALLFLDSIPAPIDKHLAGRLADYYSIKALIHDDFNEYSKLYQSNILALKYAEKEKNYRVAGQACLDLFSDIYFIDNDTIAFKYLDKAEHYYKMSDYANGLLEVKQMYAYAKFIDGDFEACNSLILQHLDSYKNVKDDVYFYMFATYMLTSNYIYLNDVKAAHKNFKEFKALKNDSTVTKYNYYSFESAINTCFADVYFEKKHLDSTLYYLDKSSKLLKYMGEDVVRDYYSINANVHKFSGKIDISKAYLDSLMVFEDIIYKSTITASYEINDSLLKAESDLQKVNESKFLSITLIIVLISILIIFSVLYLLFYRKNRFILNDLENQTENFSYLRSNNEKLTVKVQGLEDYINTLKNEIKVIATIDDTSNQREEIKAFYNDLYHNSSTLLDKTENHLALVNDLNVEFFKKIHGLYPQLNNSEVIICYYLFIGFKNKEIAVFLNTTVRAIESKRYRITKKISLDKVTLLQHIKKTF